MPYDLTFNSIMAIFSLKESFRLIVIYGKLKWKYSDEPKEKHNTIFRATKEKALKWMLNE